ncbi:uncharacterized protein [Palaemon carinicauda]|uniref:uncharacterized protein n=1 Tax=Palaemon carinicauda TaxID=392227 RepID=UPI0035B570B9
MNENSNSDKKPMEDDSVTTADCLGLSTEYLKDCTSSVLRCRTGRNSSKDGQTLGLQNTSLQNFLSRLEAQPMVVEIWGFEHLSSATFSNHVSRILTYLVVLLQLNQR